MMAVPTYNRVSGAIFAVVAAVHLYRLIAPFPVLFGSAAVPQWVSVVGLLVAGSLSVWGFRARA